MTVPWTTSCRECTFYTWSSESFHSRCIGLLLVWTDPFPGLMEKGVKGSTPKGKLGLFCTQTEPASYHWGMFTTPALVATCTQAAPLCSDPFQIYLFTLGSPARGQRAVGNTPFKSKMVPLRGGAMYALVVTVLEREQDAHRREEDASHCCHGGPAVHELCLLEPARCHDVRSMLGCKR